MAQAHLEWLYPLYSVFTSSGNPFPLPGAGEVSNNDIPSIIELAQITLQNRPTNTNSSAPGGGVGLLEDGAAADPASLGVAVLLANASTQGAVVNGISYGQAARAQTEYLLRGVPRVSTSPGGRGIVDRPLETEDTLRMIRRSGSTAVRTEKGGAQGLG